MTAIDALLDPMRPRNHGSLTGLAGSEYFQQMFPGLAMQRQQLMQPGNQFSPLGISNVTMNGPRIGGEGAPAIRTGISQAAPRLIPGGINFRDTFGSSIL